MLFVLLHYVMTRGVVYEADGMRGMLGQIWARASDTTDRDPRDTTIVDISCVALLLCGIVAPHRGQVLYHWVDTQNCGHTLEVWWWLEPSDMNSFCGFVSL